jgi:dimethylargininase
MQAITREVSPGMARCELTCQPRVSIDVGRAAAQHAEYERTLTRLGCAVRRLPSSAAMPDSVFVEDAAVVFDEVAVVMRPGAPSRRGETVAVAEALRDYRTLDAIEPPGTMDGGDVLVVGRSVLVGRSHRTNGQATEQLRRSLARFGYTVCPVTVQGCLHLKSAVTVVEDQALLVNRAWLAPADLQALDGFDLIDVDPAEPGAANVVRVGGRLVSAAAFPRTRERLERRGFSVVAVDVSEIAKAEGALTCCSLIFTCPST